MFNPVRIGGRGSGTAGTTVGVSCIFGIALNIDVMSD